MTSQTARPAVSAQPKPNLDYLSGFGNEHATEAVPGALPKRQNSPQRAPLGLYAEQISGTAFTAPRGQNRRSWLYRVRPSALHGPLKRIDSKNLLSGPFTEQPPPNRLRWDPLPMPSTPTDFIDGLVTMAGAGDVSARIGVGIHHYMATQSMTDRVFYSADGELLIVPQLGALLLVTEMGRMIAAPGEIAVIPRGVRFRVELLDGAARGYVCENYGLPFRLPELGPIGSNGLANPRDFQTPLASFDPPDQPVEMVAKFEGALWSVAMANTPLDVVAWHGNYAPYKYDLSCFNVIGSVSFDHPDPSIYTVLTSPTPIPGTANVDFVIFPPRWMVAEDTFRPPWYHRNYMNEYMGLVHGVYDAKAEGFVPGGASLHNCMVAHGPDGATYERATENALAPHKIDNSLAFMFECERVIRPTRFALETSALQTDYDACWDGIERHFQTP